MPGVMVNDRIDQDAVSSAVLAVLNNALDAFTDETIKKLFA